MMIMRPPQHGQGCDSVRGSLSSVVSAALGSLGRADTANNLRTRAILRSEEHTSELQSRQYLPSSPPGCSSVRGGDSARGFLSSVVSAALGSLGRADTVNNLRTRAIL